MTSVQRAKLPTDPDRPHGLGLEQLRRPRLDPTYRVVGKFESPLEVQGNPPDLSLIQEARQVMGYKTNYTLLEWWVIFPVGKWWRYAIAATRHFSTSFNYRYFLRCLKSAAWQDKIYQDCVKKLKHLGKVDIAREVYRQKIARPVCQTCSGSGCESCDPMVVKTRTEAQSLGLKLDCHVCQGEICLSCIKRYLAAIDQAKKSPTLRLNFGVVPGPA